MVYINFNFFGFYNKELINTVEQYANLYDKLQRNKINLYFNRTCKREKLIPHYINIQTNCTSTIAQNAKQIAEKSWLTNAIKELYTKINLLTTKTYYAQLKMSNSFDRVEYENILKQVEQKTEYILEKKRTTVRIKIEKLRREKHNIYANNNNVPQIIKHKFYQRVHNMTNITFNEQEQKILNLGLKHNMSKGHTGQDIKNQLINVENSIQKTNSENQDEIRTIFINEYSKNNRQNRTNTRKNPETKQINQIKKKLNDNNAIITKADKGNTLVIINKNDYNRKIEEYIENNNTSINKLVSNPTKKYHKEINSAINKCNLIINTRQMYNYKMIKPEAPKINGLPKIHKVDIPIRPLINFTTSPSYKIAKWLNQWLTKNIKLQIDWSIKNNIELIDKIQSINIPQGAKLASFDVTNMYTNIPVEETIKITTDLLIQNKVNAEKVKQVNQLLKSITKQNYFQYNNEFYNQTDGLPMGSPLSGTLANIYLNHIERNHIMNARNPHKNNIIYWYRYVDDVLLLYRGSIRQIEQLHQYINSIHVKIQFTLEMENEKSINFLDLNIKNENQKHNFKIHRKPTQTDHTIHNTSNHPYEHKMAAYNHMLNRLNSVPMKKEDYNEEFRIITHIAQQNGFNNMIIKKLNSKIKYKMNLKQYTTLNTIQIDNNKYIPIEYDNITSKIMKRVLKQYNYKIAFRTNNKLSKMLKNRENNERETGIYKLTCNNCPKYYIGQTGRSFTQRFKEHTFEINNSKNLTNIKSNYAQHIIVEKHTYSNMENNLQVLHKVNKGDMMNRLEEIEIYKNRSNPLLLNDKVNTRTNKIYELIINGSRL